jgi:UDP-N-acetylglucosamine 4,6-dehydratase
MVRSIDGSIVLITGGTGSFGNRVAANLISQTPSEIRIYSRDEKKQHEMHTAYPQFKYYIGDIRDAARLREAMRGVNFVFHAAALKQVPACEMYPNEAVKTNIIGSYNVLSTAMEAGVLAMVALSTDKAVKPVNAMGTSKAMMEKLVCIQNMFDQRAVYCCVRYGNVMGSRGSVIPLFQKQVREGKRLTITAPQMTRFLMTLDESVDLVFHAMRNARGGEIFVRKAPASTVIDLARSIAIKYSPKEADYPIDVVGIRPGEKIHEILVNEYEMQRITEDEKYFVIHPEYRLPECLTSKYLGEEYTSENTTRLSSALEIGGLLDRMGQIDYYT